MDIYCGKCGEPWAIDALHEQIALEAGPWRGTEAGYAVLFRSMRERFTAQGCGAFDAEHAYPGNARMAEAAAALGELLGDDVDGLAAMLDDYAGGY